MLRPKNTYIPRCNAPKFIGCGRPLNAGFCKWERRKKKPQQTVIIKKKIQCIVISVSKISPSVSPLSSRCCWGSLRLYVLRHLVYHR